MPINKLDHYSVRTTDVAKTREFYTDIIGLQVGPRPEFPFPGVWLYNGDQAVVHVIGIDANDTSGLQGYLGGRGEAVDDGTGALDHVAFVASDFEGMRASFEARKLAFRERLVPGLALNQLFIVDPNGVTIELNFAATKA